MSEQASPIVIVAPGHGDTDERVLRTAQVAAAFAPVYCLLDKAQLENLERPTNYVRLPDGVGNYPVRLDLLPRRTARGPLAWSRWNRDVALLISSVGPRFVHLHDSVGNQLMIARQLRKLPQTRSTRIIWDNHDWIPYGIAMYTSMQPLLYRVARPLLEQLYRWWARSVNAVIGVSAGHVQYSMRKMHVYPGIFVENTRLHRLPAPRFDTAMVHRILWVGNIMRVRGVDTLISVVKLLETQFPDVELRIAGNIKEEHYLRSLYQMAEHAGVRDRVRYHGSYTSDADLTTAVTTGTVGVLPAYADLPGTGVNPIVSANKVYSYLNLGIPVLLDAQLENMVARLAPYSACRSFQTTAESCADTLTAIWREEAEWRRMSNGAVTASQALNGEHESNKLREFYRYLLGEVSAT